MELVYLWVEKYKNIEKQGFDFSPRFECKFYDEYETYTDENGEIQERLKDNCKLVICDKEKGECLDKDTKKCKPCKDNGYIKDFFGDNINVTAIVGKNGSGKSSVLELIPNGSLMGMNQYFFLFKHENIIYYFLNNIDIEKIDFQNKEFYYRIFSYPEFDSFDIDFETIYIEDYNKDIEVDNSYERDEFHVKLNVKVMNSFLSLNNIEFLKNYNIDMNRFKISIRELRFNREDLNLEELVLIKDIINSRFEIKSLSIDKLLARNFFVNLVNIFAEIDKRYLIELQNYINHKYKDFELNLKEVINIMNNISRELNNNFTSLSLESYIEPYENLFNFVKSNIFNKEKYYSPVLPGINPYYIYIDISKNMDILRDFIKNYNLLINHLNDENHSTEIFKIIEINLKLSNEIEYYDLSTGEQQIYSKIIEIIHQFKKHTKKNIFYILDEPDNHLHTEWSRQFIFLLINIIKNNIQFNMKNIHFIIATHSPFLLSDIPKQNIIFLDTYKEEDEEVKNGKQKVGNCKVVDGLNDKKQTFGANIHTLLSDSFFMEDGLMGEFAKDKINNVIKFLKKEKSDINDEDEAKKIIEIIGEPFLKQKLEQMYENKYPKSKEEKIQELEAEIKRLKND